MPKMKNLMDLWYSKNTFQSIYSANIDHSQGNPWDNHTAIPMPTYWLTDELYSCG